MNYESVHKNQDTWIDRASIFHVIFRIKRSFLKPRGVWISKESPIHIVVYLATKWHGHPGEAKEHTSRVIADAQKGLQGIILDFEDLIYLKNSRTLNN